MVGDGVMSKEVVVVVSGKYLGGIDWFFEFEFDCC